MYVTQAFQKLTLLLPLLLTGCLELAEKTVPGCESNGKSPEKNPHCQDDPKSLCAKSDHMVLLGGRGPSNTYDVVLASKDGVTWNEIGQTPVHHREGSTVVHDRKLWKVGGYDVNVSTLSSSSLYSSTDGVDWDQEPNLPYNFSFADSFSFNGFMWLVGGFQSPSSSSISYSADGSSWTTISGIAGLKDGHSAVNDGAYAWILGGRTASSHATNRVLRSSDGVNWTSVGSLPSGRSFGGAAYFKGYLWYVGGEDPLGNVKGDVWKSADGVTWTSLTSLPEPRANGALISFNGALWYIGGYYPSEKDQVWKTLDGSTWSAVGSLPTTKTGNGAVFPVCGGDPEAWKTVDSFSVVPGSGITGQAIASDSNGTIYIAGTDPAGWHWVLRKSTDGGATWSTKMPIEPSGMTDGMAHSIAVDSTGAIYVGGKACNQPSNGGCLSLLALVRKSTDGGQTWTTVDSYSTGGGSGMPWGPLAMVVDNSDNIYVAGSSGVRLSTNGGTTWTTVDSGHGVATAITKSSSGTIYSAGYDGLQWKVRKSAGLNSAWSTIDTYLPNSPGDFALPKSITVDQSENIFVGGFQGVWFPGCKWCSAGWVIRRGAAAGTQWSTVDSLPYDTIQWSNARISWATAMTVDSNGNVFVAGADGNKWIVKVSRNSGASWSTIDDFQGSWGPAAIGIVNNALFVTGQASEWKTRRLNLLNF